MSSQSLCPLADDLTSQVIVVGGGANRIASSPRGRKQLLYVLMSLLEPLATDRFPTGSAPSPILNGPGYGWPMVFIDS